VAALIEGRHAVLEALRSGMPIRHVYVASGTSLADVAPEIATLAAQSDVGIENVTRGWLDAHSERGAHQGVMAAAAPFVFTPLEAILRRAAENAESLIVALDHVTDAGNFGAITRSVEVAGADGLIITKRRSAPIGAGAYKTSAGALAWLSIAQEPNLVRALETCKKAGYWIVGASEHATETLWSQPFEGKLVVVLGAEDEGLSRLTLEACDFTASLPVHGQVGSLNVAQAAAVFCYEWVRRRHGSR
jgi:23S rRNA (guanosine2251-2'-O)-methyltransferase